MRWPRFPRRRHGAERKDGPPNLARDRARMVADQLEARGISDPELLRAFSSVERHAFVEGREPYGDHALPVAAGQTISQPYIVALMTQLLALRGGERVLEVGTGSGYQAAVLAQLASEVYSVERIREMLERARSNLRELRLKNLRLAYGDGAAGIAKAAPFDSIIVAAAAGEVPQALLQQLAHGGRMILPLREGRADAQRLVLVERSRMGYTETALDPVRFVPLQPGKA